MLHIVLNHICLSVVCALMLFVDSSAADGASDPPKGDQKGSQTDSKPAKLGKLKFLEDDDLDPKLYEKQEIAAYNEERKRVVDAGEKAEASILLTYEKALLGSRKRNLDAALENANAVTESWQKNIVPLWTNDDGKRLASNDFVVRAVLRQREAAMVPEFQDQVKVSQELSKLLQGRDPKDGEDDVADSVELSDVETATTKLVEATERCGLASQAIREYVSVATNSTDSSSTAKLSELPTLSEVEKRLTEADLKEAVSLLQENGFTGKPEPDDINRFTEKMLIDLPLFENAAAFLHSLPKSFWGTRERRGDKSLLFLDQRLGNTFIGRVLFITRDNKFRSGFHVKGEVLNSDFHFVTTRVINGSVDRNPVMKGFEFEGKIGPQTIGGKYFRESRLSTGQTTRLIHGDLSFDPARPYVPPQ